MADGDAGLRVIDASRRDAPREVASYDTPGYAYDVLVAGRYAYVADGDAGLRIVDVSDLAALKEVGQLRATRRRRERCRSGRSLRLCRSRVHSGITYC